MSSETPAPAKTTALAPRATSGGARSALQDALHLLTLGAFAVAQPLFELLQRNAEFFVFRRSQPVDVFTLTLILVASPAVILSVVELLAGRLGRPVRGGMHLIFIGALCALILMPALKRGTPLEGYWTALAALGGGAFAAWVYERSRTVRSFLTVLSPAAVLFGVLFLMHPPIRKVYGDRSAEPSTVADVQATTSLVFLLFDALPTRSLVDADFEIESNLFPNFARLAGQSTWFRNATASHPRTIAAVPAILTGLRPEKRKLPVTSDYPNNLFTLLGGAYRLKVEERATYLCPPELLADQQTLEPYGSRMAALYEDLSLVYAHLVLPEPLTTQLPSVSQVWADFRQGQRTREEELARTGSSRVETFRAFVDTIDDSTEPTLYFRHSILPHQPWVYLPSGKQYPDSILPLGIRDGVWADNRDLTDVGLQRHLLQANLVDTLLGEVIDRLQATGVWERSLVIVTADHGVSFQPGRRPRYVEEATARDLMYVPLLIKEPFQTTPRINDRNVESIDILPTIADMLDVDIPWAVDGSSAIDETQPARDVKRMEDFDAGGHYLEVVRPAVFPTSWPERDHKIELFGAHPRVEDLYNLGPRRDYIGLGVADVVSGTSGSLSAHVDGRDRFADVDRSSGVIPCLVLGRIHVAASGELPDEVVVALDGIIRAVAKTHDRTEEHADFAVLLPEEAVRDGQNLLELLAPAPDGTLQRIPLTSLRLVEDGDETRLVATDGRSFVVRPGAVDGEVELARIARTRLRLRGWAADTERLRPADTVVVMQGDRHVFSSRPDINGRRHRGVRDVGFYIDLPRPLLDTPLEGSLRLFAVRGSEASELRFSDAARWVQGD